MDNSYLASRFEAMGAELEERCQGRLAAIAYAARDAIKRSPVEVYSHYQNRGMSPYLEIDVPAKGPSLDIGKFKLAVTTIIGSYLRGYSTAITELRLRGDLEETSEEPEPDPWSARFAVAA